MLRLGTENHKIYSLIVFALTAWFLSVSWAFGASADADFAKRCADPGVVKCVNFDSPDDIAGRWTNNSGLTIGASTAVIDPSVKASGAGSLLFTIPSQSWGDTSGSYFTNFSPDLSTQFGENSEFYVQWRQRFSPEFVSTIYEGNSGIKQAIITTGDQPGKVFASCESTGVVVTTYNQARVPILYQSCTGSESHGPYDAFLEPVMSGGAPVDFKLQNVMPSPFCLWGNGQYNTDQSNCFKWVPNEWMTFQIGIKTGPRVGNEFTNSYIQMWIAREGQPSQLVVSWGPYNLSALQGEKFGKVWLLPYQTSKVGTQVTSTAYTWYDELIISRTKIADPGSAPLTLNLNLTSPSNNTMLSAPANVNLAATATNTRGTVSKVEFYRDATLVSTVMSPTSGTPSSGSWTFSDSNVGAGTYRYTAKVYDDAGASTTSAAAVVSVTAVTSSGVNVAAQSQGGVASASSVYTAAGVNYSAAGANNGDRKGLNWSQGGGWNDATANAFPDWLQVNFNAVYSIGHVDVFTAQDNYTAPADPTSSLTFSQYGVTDFQVQYWDGTTWLDVPGGNVTGNNFVWRRIAFQPISTSAIRVLVNSGLAVFSRIIEVEAWAINATPIAALPTPTSGPTQPVISPPSAAANPMFNSVLANTATYLGPYTCSDVDGEWSGKCKLVTDYSGMTFDKKRRDFLVFGGGHTSTNYDGLNAFNMNTLSWNEKYKPSGCTAMLAAGNFDGTTGTWRSAPSGPAPRPISRHTVDLMAVSDDTDELVMMTYVEGNGTCAGWAAYNGFNFVTQGKIGAFNLSTNQWTFSDSPNEMQWPAAEYDPVSKKIIIVGLDGLEIYDPVTKVKAKAIDFSIRYIPDDRGQLLSFGIFRYNNNLVYYPPNQKMYYFDRFDHRVIEITLDRNNFGNSQVVALTTTGTPSGHPEPGYAYDATNQIIGGAVYQNKFYAFNPLTKSWTATDILGGAPGNQAFHAIGYDDANNVFVFITEDRQTWAYRYK